jgi:hypothetical protein
MPAPKRRRTAAPTCTVTGHEKIKLVCPACIGARGAGIPKPASARNGRLGGRPPKHSPECDVQTTGRYTPNCPRCKYDERRDDERTFQLSSIPKKLRKKRS